MMMRYRLFDAIFLAGLATAFVSAPLASAQAPTAGAVSAVSRPLPERTYRVAKEIKIQGTIQSIEQSSSGELRGMHAQIVTAQGTVNAHLGVSPNVNAKTLDLSTGDAVEITGMMAKEGGSSVLLARILTTPDRIFILRSEQGVPILGVVSRGNFIPAKATMKGGN
ncbi:MAG: hypothetical protein ABSF40_00440 [Candidatus Acidiferrales bacterium]|jgi:hypothetical protein